MDWKHLLNGERIRTYSKSTVSADLRSEFEKDYHRIIGSAAFRRLQDKTQVFPLDKNDFIRTRLTHSLEVSSFCRSLGKNVGTVLANDPKIKDFGMQEKEDICNILQCAGLIHDIGNPPFGHFGEDAIREWCEKNFENIKYKGKKITDILTEQQLNDFYNFEGNTQALRVVTKLHFLVDEHGMNLTKALLGTIVKYPVSSLEIKKQKDDIKCKKMGYFYADKEIFEEIQESLGTNGCRHPLTYLLEAADDIAYKTADIEDAVKKGCLRYSDLLEELRKYADENGSNEAYNNAVAKLEHKYETGLRVDSHQADVYAVQNWVVGIQGQMLYAASDSFIEHYDEIMDGSYRFELFKGSKVEGLMDVLGKIAYKYAFTSKPIYKLEIAADTIFNFLLDKYTNAVLYIDDEDLQSTLDKRVLGLISDDYKRIYKIYSKDKDEKEKLYLRLLLATDYISGMTDTFAKNIYQEFRGIM